MLPGAAAGRHRPTRVPSRRGLAAGPQPRRLALTSGSKPGLGAAASPAQARPSRGPPSFGRSLKRPERPSPQCWSQWGSGRGPQRAIGEARGLQAAARPRGEPEPAPRAEGGGAASPQSLPPRFGASAHRPARTAMAEATQPSRTRRCSPQIDPRTPPPSDAGLSVALILGRHSQIPGGRRSARCHSDCRLGPQTPTTQHLGQ
mmetsp:Transcript_24478/g.92484  ORF Transcript_24478/g.92484 Transcript_24478/m.92484 type:complete len:203 (-) Transcript_24478:911-1519(-)